VCVCVCVCVAFGGAVARWCEQVASVLPRSPTDCEIPPLAAPLCPRHTQAMTEEVSAERAQQDARTEKIRHLERQLEVCRGVCVSCCA